MTKLSLNDPSQDQSKMVDTVRCASKDARP